MRGWKGKGKDRLGKWELSSHSVKFGLLLWVNKNEGKDEGGAV